MATHLVNGLTETETERKDLPTRTVGWEKDVSFYFSASVS